MAIHKNATATLKNATAIFANFEKRHYSLQTLKNATPDFEKCH